MGAGTGRGGQLGRDLLHDALELGQVQAGSVLALLALLGGRRRDRGSGAESHECDQSRRKDAVPGRGAGTRDLGVHNVEQLLHTVAFLPCQGQG